MMHRTIAETERELAETTGAQRVILLCALSDKLMADDPERAQALAHEALDIATSTGDARLLVHSLQHLGYLYYCRGENERAKQYLSEGMASLADNDIEGHVQLLAKKASILHAEDKPEEALEVLRTAISLCPKNHLLYPRLLVKTGFVYTGAGLYDYALETLFEALELLTERGDNPSLTAHCLSHIADVYGALGDMENVQTYALRGLALCDENDREGRLCKIGLLTILGIFAERNDDYTTALQHYDEALLLFRSNEEIPHRSQLLQHKGVTYVALGDYRQSQEYLGQALALAETTGHQSAIAGILCSLAWAQQHIGESELALATYRRALALTETCAPFLRVRILAALAEICETMGEQKESYEWYKQFINLREQLRGEDVQRKVAQITMKYNLRKARSQAESLQVQVDRLAHETERAEHELSAMALNLIHRREGLLKLKGELQKDVQDLKGKQRKAAAALLHNIEKQLAPDDDWTLFTRQFDKAHAEFTNRLLARCPALTPTELRICALLRLNSSSKDIAHLLCLSTFTVNTHRRNIRKKLALAEPENLTTVLAQL